MKKCKWLNKIAKTIGIASLVAIPTFAILSSCAKEEQGGKIEFLKLSLDHNYVVKGEQQKVITTIEPASAQNNPLKWEIYNPHDGVTVSQDGTISVDEKFTLTYPIKIYVVATDPTNELIVDSTSFYATPSGSSDLLGFVDGVITTKDRDGTTDKKTNIVYKKDHYEVEQPLDFFLTRDEEMTFLPLFKKNAPYQMRFHIVGIEDQKHSIYWQTGYIDNQLTNTIPIIRVKDPQFHTEKIEVSFECDSSIKLIINVCTWQDPGIKTDTFVRYDPQSEDDKHKLVYTGKVSTYEANLCFDTHKKSIQIDKMTNIYVGRQPFEYYEFVFALDTEASGDVLPEIQQALKGKIRVTSQHRVRPFDHYTYYQLDIESVEFDPDVFQAKKYNYKKVQLFNIEAYDPMFGLALIIRVYVDWIL